MSDSNNDLEHPILNFTSQEKTAYSYLFNLADSDSLGVVTGERAVSFFQKTNVPAPILGEAWQIADTENRGLLTKPGFCMVLRLIGWYQGGQHQPSTELAFKPAPLPKFEGITIPGVAQSATSPTSASAPQGALQPQLSGQSTGGPIRVPPLDPAKVQQYSGLFDRSGAQNGLLDGGTAKSIFERAGLPNDVLGKIWNLSDREQKGALDQTEFIVAMHLLTSMKTRAMTALPNTLPPGLYEAAARRGQRPNSRQASIQAGAVPRQLTGNAAGAPPRTQSPLARPPSSAFSSPAVQSAQPTGPQWLITPQEKAQYDRYFATVDPSGKGVITGEQAVQFFSDSRLPEDTLASIWDLADINSEGQLNRDEFAVAMYLIRQQRAPNAPPLPPFLPAALVPPSMRSQQQAPQSAYQQQVPSAFDQINQTPRAPKASDDLFGLDSPAAESEALQQQPSLQPQGTGTSATRDVFGGNQQSAPSSPARFQPQATGGSSTFKPFIPTSAFGASLASQNTGGSTSSSQGQARGLQQGPKASVPSTMDDLLSDNDANTEESSKMTNETTELANMSNQIGNLRTQMESTQNKKAATQADLTATSNQKRDLEQRLQQFRTQYEAEVRTAKDMEQQLAASRESTKKLNQEHAMLEGSYQDLQTQHKSVSQQLQADQQENASLKEKISQINAEVARLKPELEKMKLDARQQKGLVSINKKQLATNEAERDRLQSEKADIEREAAEQSRSVAASPEPAVTSPTPSSMSTNPFYRPTSQEGASSPPPSGPTPSAFDALFGPSSAFAPSGQVGTGSATPPATSFVGRSLPGVGTAVAAGAGVGAAAIGGIALAHSMSSAGKTTPPDTVSPHDQKQDGPLDTPSSIEPPPPPESTQFTPTNLPMVSTPRDAGSDTASSTKVIPPASRAGGVETPLESASSPLPISDSAEGFGSPFAPPPEESEREIVPGAFPNDEAQPSTVAREVSPSNHSNEPSTQDVAPATQTKPADDFESAFANFGQGEKAKEAETEDPFAPSSSGAQGAGFDNEFPPIQNLEHEDDESDSDEEADRSFDDNFMGGATKQNGMPPAADVASESNAAAVQPAVISTDSASSELPDINKETSPPSYEQSAHPPPGASDEGTASNQFPREFSDLLPAREDPMVRPPPPSSAPAEQSSSGAAASQPEDEITPVPASTLPDKPPSYFQSLSPSFEQNTATREPVATPNTDVFVDASSRPTSTMPESAFASMTQTAAAPASNNAFDEFDDFGDLSEAKEADKGANDADFGFGQQSHDEFNPAFDSPAPSQTPTPLKSSTLQSQESNGFANFTPNVSTSPFGASGGGTGSDRGSLQQTPQNVQHDWDAIFSGLDSNNKGVDTSLNSGDDVWEPPPGPPPGHLSAATATTNGNFAAPLSAAALKAKEMGRAITPGTEHDDPILKRLTGMGYPRADALNALEMYDYDINKAVDHLAGN